MRRAAALALLLFPATSLADTPVVGLMLDAGDARVVPAGSELPVAAYQGEILRAGDRVRSSRKPISFLYCPEKASESVSATADVLFQAKSLKLRAGRIESKRPIEACYFPDTVRLSAASEQHYGGTIIRGLHPAAGSQGTFESRLQALAEADRRQVTAGLATIGAAADPMSRLGRAALFEKYKLRIDALAEYHELAGTWPDAVWVRGRIFDLENDQAEAEAKAATQNAGGRTLAVLVGVSHYQRLPQADWLQYAHADAELFAKHLKSPRGGGLPDTDVALLLNEKATTAAVRAAFNTFLKGRAGKNDTVILFLAAHGTVEPGAGAFILTYDSDPQYLAKTALPMVEVQNLINDDLAKAGRVLAFVDVCRAGHIGSIHSDTINNKMQELANSDAAGEILALLASRPREFSIESPDFGGGHGAFSYYLMKGLQGAADKNHDGIVDVNETIEYVRTSVAQGTHDKQHPRDFGNMRNELQLSDDRKPGIELALFPKLWRLAWQGPPQGLGADNAVREFRDAVSSGKLLPGDTASAFAILPALKRTLSPEAYLAEENRLRVTLEDRGQQVLLRYLTGDQVPQTRDDFARGAEYFAAARRLTPESLFLAGLEDFCRGRALLFSKNFSAAADLMEQATRIDPAGAWSYNGLGIAYLEQANYSTAVLAFRDAVRRAPYWAYPLHNLALADSEMGDYAGAIRAYQQAMKLAPQYSYLPYNLGLLYQRLNRRKDAEASYHRAMELAPASGEPLNALGSLQAAAGKAAEAKKLYRQALEKNSDLLAAAHNLALLLAREPDGVAEAIRLWQRNIAKAPDYLPSRLSLAETLASQGQTAAAEDQYREVLRARPEYAAARLALADLLVRDKQYRAALDQVNLALQQQPRSEPLWERKGDIERLLGDAAAAKSAFEEAARHTEDGAVRKRLRRKLE